MKNLFVAAALLCSLLAGAQLKRTGSRPVITDSKVTITVHLKTADAAATSFFPDLKYNKQAVLNVEWDDNSLGAVTALPILSAHSFSDGTGRRIPYRACLAVNGLNPNNANQELGANYPGKASYLQMKQLIAGGWDIGNHSQTHKKAGRLQEAYNELLHLNQLVQARTGYRMTYHVVPTNFPYFMQAAHHLNFLAVSTQGAKDNYPIFWLYPNNQTNRTDGLPASGVVQLNRDFTDYWENSFGMLKKATDDLLALSNASVHRFYRIGSHNLNGVDTFSKWMNYLQERAADRVWVCSTREWMEYRMLKNLAVKTERREGTRLTITVDYSRLPPAFRWYDFSLLLNTGAAVEKVDVNGADSYTFEATGKLVNVYRERPY